MARPGASASGHASARRQVGDGGADVMQCYPHATPHAVSPGTVRADRKHHAYGVSMRDRPGDGPRGRCEFV
jgi:hypothetical protein